jgi:transcriptional regulator with XRE-family HTH domain
VSLVDHLPRPPINDYLEQLGGYIRSQRKLANLTLRQLAAQSRISNPYLSQIERGLHEPSVHVLQSIARALDIAAEDLLEHAGFSRASPNGHEAHAATEAAIRTDPDLTDEQKEALLSVYRSFRSAE